MEIPIWWWLAPAGSVMALVFAYFFDKQIVAAAPGDDRMQQIAGYVREGAFAYLRQQYKVVGIVLVVLVLLWSCRRSYSNSRVSGCRLRF